MCSPADLRGYNGDAHVRGLSCWDHDHEPISFPVDEVQNFFDLIGHDSPHIGRRIPDLGRIRLVNVLARPLKFRVFVQGKIVSTGLDQLLWGRYNFEGRLFR